MRLKNPITSERVVMRQSVLASVLEIAASNLRHTDDVRLVRRSGSLMCRKQGSRLPGEPRRLAIVMTGNRGQEFWSDGGAKDKQPLDFFELKGVIEAFAADLHLSSVTYQACERRPSASGQIGDALHR